MMHHSQSFKLKNGFILLPVVFTLTILAAVAFLLSREGSINAGNVNREQQQDAVLYIAQAGYNHAIWHLKQKECTGYTDIVTTTFGDHSYKATFTDATGATLTAGSPVNIKVTGTHANGASYTINRKQIKLLGSQTELPLQPDATEGKDTWVTSASPTNNYGATSQITITTDGNNRKYYLSKFDISSIPSGSQIISAELKMYHDWIGSGNSTDEYSLYSMQEDWGEGSGNYSPSPGGATWNTSDGNNPWSWDGNYDTTAIVTSKVIHNSSGWQKWDVKSLVQDWVAGTRDNHGLLIKGSENIPSTEFYSSDSWSNRPKLIINYTSEC
jgi:hypothetical protein